MNRLRWLVLGAVVAFAAWLRFDDLHGPSFWLDEILGDQLTTQAAAQPLWRWLTGLEREHGPLYYLTQLVVRGRWLPAMFGVATVALIAFVSSRAERSAVEGSPAMHDEHGSSGGDPSTSLGMTRSPRGSFVAPSALPAALLLAISPLHVYYSREARPYALVMLLTAGVLLALLQSRTRLAIALLVALLYTSAVAAPVVASVAAIALLLRETRIALIAAIVTALFPLLYRGAPNGAATAPFPAIDAEFFLSLLRTLTTSAHGNPGEERTAFALLALALIGAIALPRRARIVALLLTLLPLAFTLVSLRLFGHWYAPRYISPAAIGFVVLAGAGLTTLTLPLRKWPAIATLLAVALVYPIAKETLPAARSESFRKLDWRAIAAAIRRHAKPDDRIIAAESWSDVSLRHYLGDDRRILGAGSIALAERYANRGAGTWFVTAGFTSNGRLREWMCRYPLVLASPLEDFRLHYAPSATDFLLHRLGAPEVRALDAAIGKGVTIGLDRDELLGDGWANAEANLRWIVARRATVAIPRGETIRFSAMPLAHPSLPRQTVRVLLNGVEAATIAMHPDWREYEVRPASWRDGMNELAFEFAFAVAPSSLDPNAHDARTLAAAFDWIAIDGGRDLQRRLVPTIRVAADVLLDGVGQTILSVGFGPIGGQTRLSVPQEKTRFPHPREAHVKPFLGRLGLDPLTIWPRIESGELHLEQVIETIAHGSDCEDDRAFLNRAFEIVLERPPSAAEARELLAALKQGWSRPRSARRIAMSAEFRDKVLR
ncbi:MAG TPA: hypothetical protein VF698_01485 [Thermoanaerobaculia bacterium]